MTTRQNAGAVYESAAEMIREGMRYADGPDPRGTASARAWHEAARRYATIPRPNFFGTVSSLAAVARLEHDAPPADIERKARELEARIADGDTSTAPRRTWTPGEDGEIDLARVADALAGNPAPFLFRRRRRIPRPERLATIVFNSMLSCNYKPKDFAERGAACAAAASALEAAGFSVAVYVESSSRAPRNDGGNFVSSYWPAKRHGEPLDLSAVWFSVRPEVTRRAAFVSTCLLKAKAGNRIDPNLGICHDAGKADACRALDIPEDTTIYLSVFAEPDQIEAKIVSGVARMIDAAASA